MCKAVNNKSRGGVNAVLFLRYLQRVALVERWCVLHLHLQLMMLQSDPRDGEGLLSLLGYLLNQGPSLRMVIHIFDLT